MTVPRLYDYWRSSAAYRVRIALNLKSVSYESIAVDLREDDQSGPGYKALNPQGLVPMLEMDGIRLTQSLAIIDYLDARFPEPHLVPHDPEERAKVLAMALAIACDIHPINNLRVLRYLEAELGAGKDRQALWYRHWIGEGFAALEAMAATHAGSFLFGDAVTLADICLVPQMYNARRFDVDLSPYPNLVAADEAASTLDAFAEAHPDAVAADSATG